MNLASLTVPSFIFQFDAHEKATFIFCVEDRALFYQDCDEPIHSAGSLSANHQRFLATGIRVALGSSCSKDTKKNCLEPPNQSAQQTSVNFDVSFLFGFWILILDFDFCVSFWFWKLINS